jgi:hypothetical protein
MFKSAFVVSLVCMLGACATPMPVSLHLDSVQKAQRAFEGELKSVSVRTAPSHEQIGKVDWAFAAVSLMDSLHGAEVVITQQWKLALEDAVTQSLLFRDTATTKYSLYVDIQRIEMPSIMTADFDVAARYRLMNRETGEFAYSRTIENRGSATLDDALLANPRLRIALIRALKGNIELFVSDFKESVPQ